MAVASSSQTMHPTAWYWHQEHWKGPKALTNHVEQLLDSPEQAQTTKAPNHNPAVSCQTPHDATRAFYTAWRDHTLYIAGRLNVAACWIMFLALLLIASSWSFWKQSFYCCCFPNVWAVHTHTHTADRVTLREETFGSCVYWCKTTTLCISNFDLFFGGIQLQILIKIISLLSCLSRADAKLVHILS